MCYMHEKIKEYLKWKASYRMHAADRYKYWLYRFVEACGEKGIEDYSVDDTVKYHNWVEERYSPTSTRYAMAILKNFFEFLQMQKYNSLAPKLIQMPRRKKPNSHLAVTEENFTKLTKAIQQDTFHSLRDLIIVHMLWDTGMRVSELCDLNISDIDARCSKATVSTKKTSNMRVVVWSVRTQELLLRYLDMRTKQIDIDSPALFVGAKGKNYWSKRLTTRSVQRMLRKYRDLLSEKITPHGFRHGWAHVRRDKGAPLPFIQRGLGHVSPASSFVYQQYSDPEFEQIAQGYFA